MCKESITNDVVASKKTLSIIPELYPGGIAIWGAVPAVYDTTKSDVEKGVHVHARKTTGGKKQIDDSFDEVVIQSINDQRKEVVFSISGLDALHYNISKIFQKNLKSLQCPNCGSLHSDYGYFSVFYHQTHLCNQCGFTFDDYEPSISNPVILAKRLFGDEQQNRKVIVPKGRSLNVVQDEYKKGIQIWGSNPAVIWTSSKLEESGIHVHGFKKSSSKISVDETFAQLSIDGFDISPEMVRHLMAQEALPFLKPYLASLSCPRCQTPHFDKFDRGLVPHQEHTCEKCNFKFMSSNEKPFSVSNPLVEIRNKLYKNCNK